MENAGASDLWLFIEPYGEDYWLKPGEAFAVAPEAAGIDVCFSIAVCQEGITVWLYEDGDPTKVVLEYTAGPRGESRSPGLIMEFRGG